VAAGAGHRWRSRSQIDGDLIWSNCRSGEVQHGANWNEKVLKHGFVLKSFIGQVSTFYYSPPVRNVLSREVTENPLFAHQLLQGQELPVRQAAWYIKDVPTFADTIAFVRQQLWIVEGFWMSCGEADMVKIPRALLDRLTDTLAFAA